PIRSAVARTMLRIWAREGTSIELSVALLALAAETTSSAEVRPRHVSPTSCPPAAAGMVSRCPRVIRPASRGPLAEVIAETVVPGGEAIPLAGSRERTMWVRAAARELVGVLRALLTGVVRAVSEPDPPGMVRRWPT